MKSKCTLLIFALITSSCVQETHLKNISFEVDMSGREFKSIGIRGQIEPLSWNKSILLADDDKDSIYSLILQLKTAFNELPFKLVIDEETFELRHKPNRSIPFEYQPETIKCRMKFNDEDLEIIKQTN